MDVISRDGRFEWDAEKDLINYRKHGLSFEKILPVFNDELFFSIYDEKHSQEEDRFWGMGNIDGILTVCVY